MILTRSVVIICVEVTGCFAVLDGMGTNPAYLVDHHFTLVAWNASACRIFGNFSLLEERERNRIWDIFVSLSTRQLYENWELATQHAVINFRTAYHQYVGDRWFEQFLADLSQHSPEFCALWSQHNVEEFCASYQEKELNHPQVGHLVLASNVLIVPLSPPFRLITYTPCTHEAASKLEQLNKQADHNVINVP